ncbi:MAG: 2-phosphosulfolactate phosphatase [Rubripirellula sp.]
MLLSTSLLPDARVTSNTQIAVVIDVLRATSVMSSALNAGAEQVITCKEVEAAKRFASERSPRPLLCGERECKPISGFDLGNSPAEYQPPVVAGRTLVMTTTNGTSAIDAATEAAEVITASFLNLSAVVQKLSVAKNIHLVCAGTNGQITAEDTLLAGAIIAQLNEAETVEYEDDDSLLALALWEAWFPESPAVDNPSPKRLSTKLRETRGGRNLLRVGYEKDLDRCSAVDTITLVPTRVCKSPPTFQ